MKRRTLMLGLLPAPLMAALPEAFESRLEALWREPGPQSLAALREAYAALAQPDEDAQRLMRRALMDLGHFDEAEALSRSLPRWRDLRWPTRTAMSSAAPRRFWELDLAAWHLQERSLDAEAPQLWVQSAMGCFFSRAAAKAMASDAELAPWMRANSFWFGTGDDLFNTRDWAAASPEFPLRLVTDGAGWSFRRPWATPTFQFVRGGRVMHQFSAWPKDGSFRPKLLEGLAAIQVADLRP